MGGTGNERRNDSPFAAMELIGYFPIGLWEHGVGAALQTLDIIAACGAGGDDCERGAEVYDRCGDETNINTSNLARLTHPTNAK